MQESRDDRVLVDNDRARHRERGRVVFGSRRLRKAGEFAQQSLQRHAGEPQIGDLVTQRGQRGQQPQPRDGKQSQDL